MGRADLQAPIGELVAGAPYSWRIALEKWGVDYCCNGRSSLEEASRNAGVEPMEVLAALDASEAAPPHEDRFNPANLTMTELADHIEATHHAYLQEELPRLTTLAEKVAEVHGDDFPWTVELAQVYKGLVAELEIHMMKEEQILFPMVRRLETALTAPGFQCGTVDNPIGVMEMEHDNAGAALRHLRELSSGYQPPPGTCVTFRVLLEGLERLEMDMHEHIHKENNVLFVNASLAERRLREQ